VRGLETQGVATFEASWDALGDQLAATLQGHRPGQREVS
jgi:hypothetical protein